MKNMSEEGLKGLCEDKTGKRKFNRSAYRYSGIGAIAFIVSLAVIFLNGFDLTTEQWLIWFTIGMIGGLSEYAYLSSAKLKKPICSNCGTRYEKYLNADRPDDTEYFYVCEKCNTYFKILHSTKPQD